MNESDEDVHPFFRFEEPDEAIACLKELSHLLENEKPTLFVGDLTRDRQPLHIQKGKSIIPRETIHALNRCLKLMKRHASDNEVIAECSLVMAYLCGECTRGESIVRVVLSNNFEVDVALPDFATGDVGCRIWGASHMISQFLLSQDDLPNNNIIEIGASSGLCGIVVAKRYPLKQVYLTDFNDACLQAAKETAKLNSLDNVQVNFLDWSLPLEETLPWNGALIIGAAVVYETAHSMLVSGFLKRAFEKGVDSALLALHMEHPGHNDFLTMCKSTFELELLDQKEVVEDAFITTVVIVRISPRA